MTPSIGREVARRGAAVLIAALALAGLATGAALHLRAVEGLDRALAASARAAAPTDPRELAADDEDVPPGAPGDDGDRPGPRSDEPPRPAAPEHDRDDHRWRVEHAGPRIAAFAIAGPDPRVPEPLRQAALREERPLFADVDGDRLALLIVERGHEGAEQHVVLVARAPAVSPLDSVGAFAALYAAFATAAGLAAAAALHATVRRALAPIDRARAEAAGVLGLGDGARLTTDAPEELRALLVGFNDLLDRLDRSAEAQARFTAEAAHELRTPVTALLGELDVCLRRPRDADAYRAALTSARDEVDRLRRVVEALTALARLDAGEADAHRQLTRAADLAHGVAAAWPHVAVTVRADPELDVHVDLVRLALSNLLRNAARHAPDAAVGLTVDRDGDLAVFTVDDAGPGLPDGDPEALFDRFTRGARSRVRDPDGLGLGLPIARQIARRHGGDCTLGPSPLGGARATITLRLPR
jgi:signal transduction histidine kinase